jgi:hypothetical protein
MLQIMNVTSTNATIEGLTPGSMYDFYVLSENEHGTSLPSAVLRINITVSGKRIKPIKKSISC